MSIDQRGREKLHQTLIPTIKPGPTRFPNVWSMSMPRCSLWSMFQWLPIQPESGNQSSPWSKLLIQVPHLFWCYRGTQLTPNPSMPCARVMWIWVKRILITPKTDWLISMTNSLGLLLPMLLTFLTHAQRRSRLELLNLDTCYPVAIFWALDHAQWFQA